MDPLRDELNAHMEERTLELIESGVPEREAREQARREFGNPTLIAETSREVWGWLWHDRLRQDLRFALRSMRRRPTFATAAVLSLALGIGANTAVFGLVHALLLESVAITRPDEIVQLFDGVRDTHTYPTYDRLRRESRLLAAVVATSIPVPRPARIVERGESREAVVHMVSGNFFDAMGVAAQRGRAFASDAEPVAVISDLYWRRHFASDPSALGAQFRYLNREFTVIGIAPPEFRGLERDLPTEIWVPLEQALGPNDMTRTRGRAWRIVGRLAPGSTMAAAQAEVQSLLQPGMGLRAGATGYSALRPRLTRPLLLLELVVGLVLLIACANLANLVLANGIAREREIAARWAIGASRGRLVRQLLTENAVLAGFGGILALGVAYWINKALLSFLPPDQAPALANLQFHLDGRAAAFALLLSLITCAMFALAPALRATREHASLIVRSSAAVSRKRNWVTRALLVSEVAMSTLLLIVAGVFAGSVRNLRGQDAGYQEERLLVADFEGPRGLAEDPRDRLLDELRVRAASLPGVLNVAFSNLGQLSGGGLEFYIRVAGREQREASSVLEQRVSDGFFSAMGTRLIEGREFTPADRTDSTPVAIVNQAFAMRYLAAGSPIGQRFAQETGSRAGEFMEVIGVVQDSKWIDLRAESPPMYYRPYSQQGGSPTVRLAIRVSGNADAVPAGLAQIAAAIDSQMVVKNVVPFEEIVDRSLLIERLVAYVSSASGVLAVLIAALGLYGVLAHQVARRRREIGVRIALGAAPRSVEWMVLRESLALFAAGFALGVPLAILVTRSVSAMLFGLSPEDPATIATMLAALAATTAAAAYFPARRASRVDPISALRSD